jgi:hypothetical protein
VLAGHVLTGISSYRRVDSPFGLKGYGALLFYALWPLRGLDVIGVPVTYTRFQFNSNSNGPRIEIHRGLKTNARRVLRGA